MTSSSDFRVTLLGTGVPTPRPDRFGPSTLVEVGNQRLLIDAGRGAAIRLYQVGVPMGSIDALLLTHYHSDHRERPRRRRAAEQRDELAPSIIRSPRRRAPAATAALRGRAP